MKLELTEEDLTSIIKEAIMRYASKPFGRASFSVVPNGIMVQFHDGGEAHSEPEQSKQEEVDPLAPAKQMLTTWALMGLGGGMRPDPTPTVSMPDFGGGSSGGAGASGDW